MPDSSIPATDTDNAEADYFNEQESLYSVNTARGPKSYKNFAISWNLEVSRRFKLWSQQGDEDAPTQLQLKSAAQLEDYYNKKRELTSLQHTANSNDSDRASLNSQLRTTREQLPPRQEPHIVQPTRYTPQLGAITPFAHPTTTLNAYVAMAAVAAHMNNNLNSNNNTSEQQRQSIVAPFRIERQNLRRTPRPRPIRKVFRSKMLLHYVWMEEEVEHTEAMRASLSERQ